MLARSVGGVAAVGGVPVSSRLRHVGGEVAGRFDEFRVLGHFGPTLLHSEGVRFRDDAARDGGEVGLLLIGGSVGWDVDDLDFILSGMLGVSAATKYKQADDQQSGRAATHIDLPREALENIAIGVPALTGPKTLRCSDGRP